MIEKIIELEIRTNYENELLKDIIIMVDKKTYLREPKLYDKVIGDYELNHKIIKYLKEKVK